MALRFSGTFEELKTQLSSLASSGTWTKINPNQHQFRHKNGGVLNWYPSTGAINFQGQLIGRDALEAEATVLLHGEESTPASVTAPTPAVVHEALPEIAEAAIEEKIRPTPASVSDLRNYPDSEIVIGLVGAVGTEMDVIITLLKDRLKIAGYHTTEIRVSRDIIPKIVKVDTEGAGEATRISRLMDAGDLARKKSEDSAILATGVAAHIAALRKPSGKGMPRHAFIVNSLKHPDEVHRLRQIYPRGFHLFGVHPDENVRLAYMKRKGISNMEIERLIERDQDEHLPFGQRVNDTFHMSDFFVRLENVRLKLENSIIRIFHILFGDPYKTPTFEEFAMFLAFTSSLRSADLSRQVGAVVTNSEEILATGANDCPKFAGGLYWPELNSETYVIEDKKDGRDYMRGEDSNKIEQRKIMDGILKKAKM